MTIVARFPAPIESTDTPARMKLNTQIIIDFEASNGLPGWFSLLLWLLENNQDPSLALSQMPNEVKPDIERYLKWANKPRISTAIVQQWKIALQNRRKQQPGMEVKESIERKRKLKETQQEATCQIQIEDTLASRRLRRKASTVHPGGIPVEKHGANAEKCFQRAPPKRSTQYSQPKKHYKTLLQTEHLLARRLNYNDAGEEEEQVLSTTDGWQPVEGRTSKDALEIKKFNGRMNGEPDDVIDSIMGQEPRRVSNDHCPVGVTKKVVQDQQYLSSQMVQKLEEFDKVFRGRGLDVQSPLSRFIFRLLQGPDLNLLRENYSAFANLPDKAVPLLKKIITSMQSGEANAYRQIVPNLDAALNGWFAIRKATKSIKCYERLSMGIAGIEILGHVQRLSRLGYEESKVLDMAKRCMRPRWDVLEDDNADYEKGRFAYTLPKWS